MELIINGDPEEIAALVLAVQERREVANADRIIGIIADSVAGIANSSLVEVVHDIGEGKQL